MTSQTAFVEYVAPTRRNVRANEGGLFRVPRCPFCGRPHSHGAGGPDDDPRALLSHRVAHCGRGGYVLVLEGGRVLPMTNRAALAGPVTS